MVQVGEGIRPVVRGYWGLVDLCELILERVIDVEMPWDGRLASLCVVCFPTMDGSARIRQMVRQ